MRIDGRRTEQPRQTRIQPGILATAEGSALIEAGNTKVISSATVENRVPTFLRGAGRGWVTAEYGMLPRSTSTRTPRLGTQGRPSGRTFEIQRLIGRSLRTAVDMEKLGERTITVDCDVMQADGGTRTASITGGWVAMACAVKQLLKFNVISASPLRHYVAAISVGIVDGVLAEQPGEVDPGGLDLPLSVQELHDLGKALHAEDVDVLDHRRFRAVGAGQEQALEPLRPDGPRDGPRAAAGLAGPIPG